jgi:serine/threonine protein kinase
LANLNNGALKTKIELFDKFLVLLFITYYLLNGRGVNETTRDCKKLRIIISKEDVMKGQFKALGYSLINKIGEGGFGSVFKAIQIKTQQIVAIKILHPQIPLATNTLNRQKLRFDREMALCSQLEHPNIVRFLDKGNLGENFYGVFSYIEGISLKQKLFSYGALYPIDAFNIMMQVLKGLIHAHSLGIVHRDIKPANIMLTVKNSETHVRVIDFGIGTLIDSYHNNDFQKLTLAHETLGSPVYSAPEYLTGRMCCHKADIYSWGLTLLECLTGRPAVSALTIASAFIQQHSVIPHAIPIGLSKHPVARLLRGVLHKNVSQRLDNAADIYRSMSRLDFTTLITNLADESANNDRSLSKRSEDLDDTKMVIHTIIDTELIEKKQITVMCIKFEHPTHSDPLSSDNNDLEIDEQLFQQRKEQCISIAQNFGATHMRSFGDSLLIYFGYPNVNDDDCRLCAKSALEMAYWHARPNKNEQQPSSTHTIHIGVHSGLVLIRHDGVSEGQTSNIAMSLSRQAGANQILCSDATRQILTRHYHCEVYITGNSTIKNMPFQTHVLLQERRSESSRITRKKKALSSFCARQTEFNTLKTWLSEDNAPNHLHIHGETGMGKSWLVAHFYLHCTEHDTHKEHLPKPIIVRCRPEQRQYCLHPIVKLLNLRFRLCNLDLYQRTQRLSELLSFTDSGHSKNTLSLLCSWLGYTHLEEVQSNAFSYPDSGKKEVFCAIRLLLCLPCELKQQRNFVYVIDDLHWADPISLECINDLLSSDQFTSSGHRIFSVSNESFVKDITSLATKKVRLAKLDKIQTHMLLIHIFAPYCVGKDLEEYIFEHAEGNPMYLRELAETLKRNGQIKLIKNELQLSSVHNRVEIPFSLRDQLQQKLDRLKHCKSIGQIASIIGNEFEFKMLLQHFGQNKAQLQSALEELLQSDVICYREHTKQKQFYFKHKLLRNIIYESAPQTLRQQVRLNILKYERDAV